MPYAPGRSGDEGGAVGRIGGDRSGRGRSGIRTHETLARPTVFKTVAFVRSAILPGGCYPRRHDRRPCLRLSSTVLGPGLVSGR